MLHDVLSGRRRKRWSGNMGDERCINSAPRRVTGALLESLEDGRRGTTPAPRPDLPTTPESLAQNSLRALSGQLTVLPYQRGHVRDMEYL